MDFNDFILGLRQTARDLENDSNQITLSLGNQALADIQNRVQERGERPTGGSYGGYSEKKVPAYLLVNSSINAQGRNFAKKKAKNREGVSYKELRAAEGLPTNKKNFTRTGRMFANMAVEIISTGNKLIARIQGRNQATKDKLEYNTERDGAILQLSPSEVSDLAITLDQEVQLRIDRNL